MCVGQNLKQVIIQAFSVLDMNMVSHYLGKCIIGMKTLGEGHLTNYVLVAITYAKSPSFITSIVVGCCSRNELAEVIETVDSC